MKDIKTNKALYFLKKIDVFGVEFIPSLFSQKQYKTVYGSVLTLILIILTLYKILLIFSDAINKTNFTVTEEKDILNGKDQLLSSFGLTICADKFNNDTFIFADPQSQKRKLSANYNKKNSKLYDEKCYSYNLSNLTISSDSKKNNHMIKIIIYEKKVNDEFTDNLKFYIEEIFIKRSDYNNPIRSKNFKITVDQISKINPQIELYLQTIRIIHKDSFNFGYLKNEPTNSKNYISYYSNTISTMVNYENMHDYNSAIMLILYHSDWITTYTFIGFNFEIAISDFGGYINICFIVLKFIGELINNFLFQKKIFQEINKKNNTNITKNNSSIIKDSSYFSSSSSSSQNMMNNDMENANIINILNQKKILSEMKDISDEDLRGKIFILNNIDGNKNKSSFINSTEEQKRLFESYKIDCDKANDRITIEESLYKDLNYKGISKLKEENIKKEINKKLFMNALDYGTIYKNFKEIKLLEFILLKTEDFKFYMENKRKNIDFNRLKLLTEDENIQKRIFSSKMNKQYILNKCIM